MSFKLLKPMPFLSEIIPFLLLLFLFLYPSSFVLASNTILGKIIAIAIILFYFVQDILIGIFVTLIFLCFYQTDIVHNICKSENFDTITEPFSTYPDSVSYSYLEKEKEKEKETGNIIPYSTNTNSKLSSLTNQNKINIQSESETIFKNQHCNKDLEFVYKKQVITHPETIQMLFKELKFIGDQVCNPCDPTCKIKTNTNTNITMPQSLIGYSTRGDKTAIEEAFEWANTWIVNKLEPYFGVGGGHTASYL